MSRDIKQDTKLERNSKLSTNETHTIKRCSQFIAFHRRVYAIAAAVHLTGVKLASGKLPSSSDGPRCH